MNELREESIDEPASPARTDAVPLTGHPDAWIKARLAELDLTAEDIDKVVEGTGGLHAHGGRWKICPGCKSNIDMLTWVEGKDGQKWPRLLTRAEIECPNCGAYGETMGDSAENAPHPKLKTYPAQPVHNPYPWASRYVKLGKAIVEANGLFPADPQFDPNEPHWPRDLGACLIGAAIIIASTIQRAKDAGDGTKQGQKPGKPSAGPRKPSGNSGGFTGRTNRFA